MASHVVQNLLVGIVFLVLLLPTTGRRRAFLLLMHNQPRPRLFLVPLEARKHRKFQLVVGLVEDLSGSVPVKPSVG